MELKFEVSGRISKPIDEVFEAVVNPKQLSKYFTTGGADGRLETGVIVYWKFAEFPDSFPVKVLKVEKNRRIIFQWESDDSGKDGQESYNTTVTMRFEELDGNRTLVSIAEEGWHQTPAGQTASYGNCMGWSQMLCALKAHLEYGINLRDNMYK